MGDIETNYIPSPLLYNIKKISGISKQTIKIVPSSGQSAVSAGQKIIISLPSNTLIDLSTCILNFTGATTHAGGQTAVQVKRQFFPRNIASIIENLEIKMSGQTIQNISQYGYLYNILYDLTQGKDGESRRKIGENADPSHLVSPSGETIVGYCSATSAAQATEANYYSIRSWLGFLGGNASTNVIDTMMTGQIDIEITLAPASCLMEGSAYTIAGVMGNDTLPAETANYTLNNISLTCVKYDMPSWYYDSIRKNLEAGEVYPPASCLMEGSAYTIAGVMGNDTLPAETANYTLNNISLTCVKYDMPSWYYDSIRKNLEAGEVYPIYYPNYSAFFGQTTTNKSCSTRFSVSTSSLDMVIGTFQANARTTIGGVINSVVAGVPAQAGTPYTEANSCTATALVSRGTLRTFNNSKKYQRDGMGVVSSAWTIGHVQLNPSTVPEQFNNCLTAFGIQNDTLGGISPLIQTLYHYQDTFYCDILSTKFVEDNDGIYTVSGLDSKEQVFTIGWDVVGGGNGANTGTPILFACYNSHVDILNNRFIQPHA